MGWKKKKKEAKGSWKKQSAKETKESREGQNWERWALATAKNFK